MRENVRLRCVPPQALFLLINSCYGTLYPADTTRAEHIAWGVLLPQLTQPFALSTLKYTRGTDFTSADQSQARQLSLSLLVASSIEATELHTADPQIQIQIQTLPKPFWVFSIGEEGCQHVT